MKRHDDAKAYILAAAALGALPEARRQSADLLSRRSAAAAPALLRAHASAMAASSLGRDQVLSLALFRAADELDGGRSPAAAGEFVLPELGTDAAARLTVRARALKSGLVPMADARRVVEALERRHRVECADDVELSARLIADANLHERLWDDPRLPGDDRARLAMLYSVPQLLERVEALRPPGTRKAPAGVEDGRRSLRRFRGAFGAPVFVSRRAEA